MSYGPVTGRVRASCPPGRVPLPESSRARGQPLFQYAGAATLPPSGEAVTIPATARRATRDFTFYDPGRELVTTDALILVWVCVPL